MNATTRVNNMPEETHRDGLYGGAGSTGPVANVQT
eukprot:COSAG02_NODE_3699_length_6364_cov_1.588132_4_plen_34_part_01